MNFFVYKYSFVFSIIFLGKIFGNGIIELKVGGILKVFDIYC